MSLCSTPVDCSTYPRLVRRILSRLRAAAGPSTKLLLGEIILENPCANKTEDDSEAVAMSVPLETKDSESSLPLPPNLGVSANILGHLTDILVRRVRRAVANF